MKKEPTIVIAVPQEDQAEQVKSVFAAQGFNTLYTDHGDGVMKYLETSPVGAVFCAYSFDRYGDGLDVLMHVRRQNPAVAVIMLAEEPDLAACKQSLKRGAYDFFVAPPDRSELERLARELRPTGPPKGIEDFVFPGVVSRSPAMQGVYRILRRVAPTDLTVLIEGESGTGKELTARSLHANSKRADKPFYPINCAGLAESLLESELFGHVKGAFTGATADRKGLFQLADKGTLFLDEIGDMPALMQAKLLRVLEDGLVLPVGGSTPIKVDVRVISATNHDLAKQVEEKQFRQDLYFRIKGVSVTLPPLRNRPQDIPELFGYFLKQACEEIGTNIHLITEPAMRALMSYSWPGNIRQLRHVVRTTVALCDRDTIDLRDLPPEIARVKQLEAPLSGAHLIAAGQETAGLPLEEVEREHIRRTLELTGQNRAEAAKLLKIGERTLYRKIKEYNL
ncbi:MAG TPA: sigma-54-dependent Fis family transcriptional regulator [Phycisphaerales bacterium]|nr:sigma-54-dependent Fis family transcriptional regulator [Phycisphaerales bacterium]